MKKAIVILCVLTVLTLLAVPILAEGLSAGGEPNRQMSPRDPGTVRRAKALSPVQIARIDLCPPAPAAKFPPRIPPCWQPSPQLVLPAAPICAGS